MPIHVFEAVWRVAALTVAVFAVLLCFVAAAAGSVSISTFEFASTSSRVGAHPSLQAGLRVSTSRGDALRTVSLDLPANMEFSLDAASARCASISLTLDRCPAGSNLGDVTADLAVSAVGLPVSTRSATGALYALDYGAVGVVLRSAGYANLVFQQQLTMAGNRVRASVAKLPNWIFALGVLPLNVKFQSIQLAYRAAPVGSPSAPPWIVTNPATCASNSARLAVTSSVGGTASASRPYAVTGCDTTPPTIEITAPADGSSTADQVVDLDFSATDDSGEEPSCDRSTGEQVTLTPGANEFTVTCTDAVGNTASASTHVTYVPPQDEAAISDATLELSDANPDAAAVDNHVIVTTDAGMLVVEDHNAPVSPPSGCAALSANKIACPLQLLDRLQVQGGPGDDVVTVMAPIDAELLGDAGDDRLTADLSDRLVGGTGDDTLQAGPGDDFLMGEAGDDTLLGEEGDDVLDGGSGSDFLDGGSGVDRTFANDDEADTATCDIDDVTAELDATDTNNGCTVVNDPNPKTFITSGPSEDEFVADATPTFRFDTFGPGVPDAQPACSIDFQMPTRTDIVPCASPYTSFPLSDGPHSFATALVTEDLTPASSGDIVEFTVDTSAPEVEILSPADGSTTFDPFVTVSLQVEEANLSYCTPSDGTQIGPFDPGPNSLDITCVDLAGNETTVTTEFTVLDAPQPNTTITDGPAGLTNDSRPAFTFSGDGGGVPWALEFECNVDDGAWASCSTPYVVPDGLSDGTHTFAVRAVSNGVPDPSPAVRTLTVDTAAPDTFIDSGPGRATRDTSPTWAFHSDDPGATFECSLVTPSESATFGECSGGQTGAFTPLALLPEGDYDFAVRAIDVAGNEDESPAQHVSVRVDLTPPAVGILYPLDGSVTGDSAPALELSVYDATQTTCSPQAGELLGPYALGTHTVVVSCTDEAGNEGTGQTTFTVVTPAIPDTELYSPPPLMSPDGGYPYFRGHVPAGEPEKLSFECALDDGAYEPCESGFWTGALGYPSPGVHKFAVRALNFRVPDPTPAMAYFMVSDPDTPYMTFDANSSDTGAAAHPDLTLDFGFPAETPTQLDLYLPAGMYIAPAAIPAANRCSQAVAAAGACTAASQIGTVTATVVTSEFGAETATGSLHFTNSPSNADLVGVSLQLATPHVSLVTAKGGVQFDEQFAYGGRNPAAGTLFLREIPSGFVSGPNTRGLHIAALSLSLDGDLGGGARNLVTNGSACTPAIGFAIHDTIKAEAGNAGTASVTDFAPTGCSSTNPAYAPTFTQTLTNPVAGETTGAEITMDFPPGDSTTRSVVFNLPAKLTYNNAAVADTTLQCSEYAARFTPVPYGSRQFDVDYCPSSGAEVGTMTIETPLFEAPIVGTVFLTQIPNSSLTHLGVSISNSTPGNPRGDYSASLLGRTSIYSDASFPQCGPVEDEQPCYDELRFTWSELPDIPITRMKLSLPAMTRGDTPDDDDLLRVRGPGDPRCDGGAYGASQDARVLFEAWSRSTTGPLRQQTLVTDGC